MSPCSGNGAHSGKSFLAPYSTVSLLTCGDGKRYES